MNKLIEFFAKNGVFANLLTISLISLGIFAALTTKREAFPNISFDIVTITAIYPGSSAEEVEKLIVNPLEQDLKEIDGIKKLSSIATENRGYIIVQLDPDQTNMQDGKSDVQEVVDAFTDFPEDAETPVVKAMDSSKTPVLEVSLSGPFTDIELLDKAKYLEKQIEDIKSVANAVIRNERKLEIKIETKPKLLKKYSLSILEVFEALKAQNLSIPGGTVIDSSGKEKIIRTKSEINSIDDVKNTIIRTNDYGRSIKISDIANVKFDIADAEILNFTRGLPTVSLTVLKKDSADSINLVTELKNKLNKLKIDPKLKIEYLNDNSYYVKRRLKILLSNLAIGLVLVLIILAIVMKPRIALIVAIGIPFSFLGTLLYFQMSGVSINLLTLMGLIIVLGMLVDDAIVVTDNAVRHIEDGLPPMEAAIKATQEIWFPTTVAVMTTVFSFSAFFFMSGIFGKFASIIPIPVVAALIFSLFECFFILPHHIGGWLSVKYAKNVLQKDADSRFWDRNVMRPYKSTLRFVLRLRYLFIFVFLCAFAGCLFLGKQMKFDLFPKEGIEIFQIRAETAVGSPLLKTKQAVASIEKEILKLSDEELDSFSTTIGLQQNDPNDPNKQRGSQYAEIKVYLTPEPKRDRTAKQIIADLKTKITKNNELTSLYFNRINPGPPVGKAISIGVNGDDYPAILKAVEKVKEDLKNITGIVDIQDNYIKGKEELQIIIDNTAAKAAGLNPTQIGMTVRAAFEGLVATTIKKFDDEIEVLITYPKIETSPIKAIQNLMIPNRFGNLIRLRTVAKIEPYQGIASVIHENRRRQVKVNADILDTQIIDSRTANSQMEKNVPKYNELFPNITYTFGGENEDTNESIQSLMKSFVIAVILIFLMLVLLFKNIIQPIQVLVTLPLGVMSVILAFYFNKEPISFLGLLGVIALSGVIVNNAVVFIDFINKRRLKGESILDSVVNAAGIRLRPIFLTTMTSVIGILPTAYGWGGLDKFIRPIALALGWGLFFGSMLTIFVIPLVVRIWDDLHPYLKRFLNYYVESNIWLKIPLTLLLFPFLIISAVLSAGYEVENEKKTLEQH